MDGIVKEKRYKVRIKDNPERKGKTWYYGWSLKGYHQDLDITDKILEVREVQKVHGRGNSLFVDWFAYGERYIKKTDVEIVEYLGEFDLYGKV